LRDSAYSTTESADALSLSSASSAPLATLARTNLREAARDALRAMIINGQLPVGLPLRQDELAAQLGISRTPLREALHVLVGEGLVRMDPHRGAVVTKPTPKELMETYEIRETLEVLAGRLAARFSTPDQIAQLRGLHDSLADTADPDAWAEANGRFHVAVYSVTGKSQLIELIDMLRNRAKLYVRILAAESSPARRADDEHAEMIEALAANDEDAMEDVVRRHLRSTAAVVAPLLSDGGAP